MKNAKTLVLGAMLTVSGLLAGCGEDTPAVASTAPVAPPAAPVVAAPAPAPIVPAVAPVVVLVVASVVALAVPDGPAYDPKTATCTLTFKVKAKGTLPRMRPIKFDADPKCGAAHKDEVPNQTVVAGKEGQLANVIVWVSKGCEKATYATPTEAALIDQNGCMYVPHVLTVMVNQPITIKSSDPTMHNIHAMPKDGEEFNKSQQPGAGDLTTKFTKEEVAVKVKCDVHSWMGARIGVFAHPFHGVTGADGTVSIKVPPGEYEVSAWHEYEKWSVKPEAQKVKVAGTETKEVEFSFEVK